MNTELIIAVLAGCGGMIGWGFSEFAAKKAVDTIGTISSLVWAHVFGTLILCALLLLRILTTNTFEGLFLSLADFSLLLLFGALQAIVYYFAYKGFEKGQVSILSPIFSSFAALVAICSILFLGETIHGTSMFALPIIFVGVLLINIKLEGLRLGRIHFHAVPGLKEIVIATILATIWTLGWNVFSDGKDWLVYTTLLFAGMTVSAFLIAKCASVNLNLVNRDAHKFLWWVALGEVIGYLAITVGYANTTHTSIVAILSGASSVPTIFLAQVFLSEKMTRIQAVSSLLIIAGIVLLSIS